MKIPSPEVFISQPKLAWHRAEEEVKEKKKKKKEAKASERDVFIQAKKATLKPIGHRSHLRLVQGARFLSFACFCAAGLPPPGAIAAPSLDITRLNDYESSNLCSEAGTMIAGGPMRGQMACAAQDRAICAPTSRRPS